MMADKEKRKFWTNKEQNRGNLTVFKFEEQGK